jgi:CO/xanthine dehydrogenase Mo-binding subunit
MRYGVGASGAAQAPGRASLELAADGRVRLLTGAMDLGQGSDTALALIVADELALAPSEVSVVTGDTGVTSDAGPTSGSRLVYYVGNAARDAAVQLRQAILSTASELLERPLDELRLLDGEPAVTSEAGGPPLTVTLGDVARARDSVGLALRFDGEFYPPPAAQDVRTGVPSPYAVYVSATHMAEVEVDLERGAVRVLRVVAAHDVGRAVFPQGVKGQIEGAVAMGIGFALKEEFLPGETVGFKEYRIPTAREMPEVVTLLVELGDPSAGLGAKGVAECATVAVAPAIANGIADATGARVRRLPATPERLKALLAAASS